MRMAEAAQVDNIVASTFNTYALFANWEIHIFLVDARQIYIYEAGFVVVVNAQIRRKYACGFLFVLFCRIRLFDKFLISQQNHLENST